jgi:hypothetical protein
MKSLLFILIFSTQALAQGNGAIPLSYSTTPATDLIFKGENISSSRAFELSKEGIDLSNLEPSEEQDIWKNQFVENTKIQNEITPYQTVEYKSFVLSQTGKLRFLAKTSSGETLNFITSKNVHTQLMRRNLLVKIGYQVPELSYVPKLKINFSSPIDRELFVKELSEKTLGDPKRWIISEDEKSIVMNDLVTQKTNSDIVDLSIGYIPSSMIKGRRVLNSLHALYSLTDFAESANMFSWSTGYIFNEHLHLPYQFETEFFAGIDDIKWITGKIAQLNRADWTDIVSKSYLPEAVEKLIIEKLIARRNNLLTLVKSTESLLNYNPKISFGNSLIDGELVEEKFEGYAARFSFGDPESPLNIKEFLYYGGVKVIGTLIEQLVNKFNALPFLNNTKELEYKILERYNRNFLEQVFHLIETGEYKPVPFGVYALPSVNGGIIANRDVIAGNYLGTDNLFQLVDTVGVSGFAGAYIGMEGFESITGNLPVSGSGKAGVYYNRLYSHVKPIQSMKAALKYPISNILVPLAQIKVGRKLKNITAIDENELTEEDKKELTEKLIPIFNEKMLPGESFIITDTLGASIQAEVNAGFSKILTASIGAAGNQMVISRLHIFKTSESEFQIYRDLGNVRSFQTQAKLNAIIPIIKVRYGVDQGKIKMDFYKIKLDKSKFDAEEKEKYAALREVFLKGTIGKLKNLQVPVKFRYKLKQQTTQGSILIAQGTKINSRFNVRVLHPEGQQLDLFRRYTAKSSGMNYAAPGTDAFDAIVRILTQKELGLQSYDGGGNAGFTFFGKAKSKVETFESTPNFLNEQNYTPVVKVSRIWNGWSINQKKALKILAEIKNRYAYDFFPPDVLNETKKIFLYSFHVNFTFYHDAIRHVLALTDEQIDTIVSSNIRDDLKLKKHKIKQLKKFIRKSKETTDLVDLSQYQNKVFDLIESVFTIKGIEQICGGKQNFFVYSKIEGFRSKDENGDQPIFSNSYGEYGHFMVSGPFDYLKRLLGISDAELGINWQLRRIY